MPMSKDIVTKKEPVDMFKPLFEQLGYDLVKKDKSSDVIKPKGYKELEKMTEDELKAKRLQLEEQKQELDQKVKETKAGLLEHFKKQGPTEFTKILFAGTTIPPNRVMLQSKNQLEIGRELGYVDYLLKELKKMKLIEDFAESNIKSLKIEQGNMGLILKVALE